MTTYVVGRKTRTILKYGLYRRTETVMQQFRRFSLPQPCIVLDIGTADGLLLRRLMEGCELDNCTAIGIDTNFHCLKSARENVSCALQADGRRLPLCAGSVDVVISTSVFKHVKGLKALLQECRRVLELDGKIVATDPTPLGIRLGFLLGHFTRRSIAQILSLKATRRMLTECGFKVVSAERFMLSPIPFWGCDIIERVLKRMHLDRVFLCQVVCAEPSTG